MQFQRLYAASLYPELCTTQHLQGLDSLTYESGLERIKMNAYTLEDLVRLFRNLNSTNYPGEGIHESLYEIFYNGMIPHQFLYEIFEKKDEHGYPEVSQGPVREIYDRAMKDRKKSEKK